MWNRNGTNRGRCIRAAAASASPLGKDDCKESGSAGSAEAAPRPSSLSAGALRAAGVVLALLAAVVGLIAERPAAEAAIARDGGRWRPMVAATSALAASQRPRSLQLRPAPPRWHALCWSRSALVLVPVAVFEAEGLAAWR